MATRVPFPEDVDTFGSDERISYSAADQTWLLVDEFGEEWEFNTVANKWFQPATDEQIAAMQGYNGDANGSDEETNAAEVNKKKRKAAAAASNAKKQVKKEPENRAVYVRNIPLDASREDIEETFGRYGGMIDQGIDGAKRVKMYADDQGNFNGEALIVFFKKDSVQQAIRMLDDFPFRIGDTNAANLRVEEADMSYKKNQDKSEIKFVRRDKKASERTRAELNRKLAEWSDDDEPAKELLPHNKYAQFAIIKKAFTLKEIEEDPQLVLDIKEDMREQAETCGEVTNCVLYDKESEGVLSIRFKDPRSAEEFVTKTNGKGYAGQKLHVYIPEDRFKFKKSGKEDGVDSDEEAERLERFGEELERA
ncbi:hypothetical protein BDV96DRAFT_269020 [Lophiotrema nucula]|uniref:RRM domain-containing protein n=1 Tax=Lophiotrema nucula TaxID=690887 RepID=A0A6A5ZQI7_9PLEO|nr:hypothetical protein BDV96DRAFT_269020 [Lophiotrema nucula]